MSIQLLLAIPDASYSGELKYIFETDGYAIRETQSIRDAVRALKGQPADLILCDMQYADGTGLTLIEKVREKSQAPMIVVTEVAEDLTKVLALEYGADDFLVKPFNILELKARMRSVLRRSTAVVEQDKRWIITVGELSLHIIGRQVQYGDQTIELTGKEFDILLALASDPGTIFDRHKLAMTVWNDNFVGDVRTVDVHVKRIRRKFKDAGVLKPPLQTKWGEGYYIPKM